MTKNYLITGGAGFIGSNYVHQLLSRGESVTILDNFSRGGAPRNLDWLEKTFGKDSFRLIRGDVRDASIVAEAAQTSDVIVHLAGQVAVTTSVVNPRDDFENNASARSTCSKERAFRDATRSSFTRPRIKFTAAWKM